MIRVSWYEGCFRILCSAQPAFEVLQAPNFKARRVFPPVFLRKGFAHEVETGFFGGVIFEAASRVSPMLTLAFLHQPQNMERPHC